MDEDDLFIKQQQIFYSVHRHYDLHYNISPSKKNSSNFPATTQLGSGHINNLSSKREKCMTTTISGIHHLRASLQATEEGAAGTPRGKAKRKGNKQIRIRAKLMIDDLLVVTPDWAICSVCNEVFKQPVVTECGHTYCLQCLTACHSKSKECPLCRKAFLTGLIVKELSPNLQLVHVIDTLKVRCRWGMKISDTGQWIPDPDGCSEITEWQCLFAHDEVCGFVPVPCPYKNCSLLVQRRNLEHHQTICEERNISCDLCNVTYAFKHTTEHKKLCPQYKSLCPKGCGQLIANQNRKIHLQKDCPEIEVHCVYQDLGCTFKDKKRKVDEHLSACIFHTLKPFILQTQKTISDLLKDQQRQFETIKEQQKEIFELKQQVEQQRQLVDQQEQEIKQLKIKQQNLTAEHQMIYHLPSIPISVQVDNTKSFAGVLWNRIYRFIDPRDFKPSPS